MSLLPGHSRVRLSNVDAIVDASNQLVGLVGPDGATANFAAIGSPVTVMGASGLNLVVTAIIAAGWTFTSLQWKRNTSGTVVNVGTLNSLTYQQVAADVVPGVRVYPEATGLVFSAAGLVATVPPLSLSGTPSATAAVGVPYSFTPTVSGGTGPNAFSLPGGPLPVGLTLNTSTGVIAGTPTTAVTSAGIVIRVTDSLGATADLGPFSVVVAAVGPGYDIFLLAGQSKMAGRGVYDGAIDTPDANVFQFDSYPASATYRQIIPAADRLKHPELGTYFPGQTLVGPGMSFAKAYAARTGRKVLLVPVAFGGTSLVAGASVVWSPYGSANVYFLAAIDQTNRAIAAALAQFADSVFKGTLWDQGEGDGDALVSQAVHTTALLDMANGMRSGITGGANSLFIMNRLLPEAIAAHAGYAAIDAALVDVASALVHGGILTARAGHTPDDLHYDALGSRLEGFDFDAAIPAALNYVPAVPGTPTGLSGTASGTSVSLSMTAPATGGFVLDYEYEYSLNGTSGWTLFADGIGRAPSATVSGLAATTPYYFRSRCSNTGAAGKQWGPYSNIATATTGAAAAAVNIRLGTLTVLTETGDDTAGRNYVATAVTALATAHAGVANKKLPAGVAGSFSTSYISTMNSGNNVLLGAVLSQTDPAYSAGGSGYKFGILNHSSGTYRVIVDGGSTAVAATTAVTPQTGDILQLRRDVAGNWFAEVARAASPTVFTTIYSFASVSNVDTWPAISIAASASVVTTGPLTGIGVV